MIKKSLCAAVAATSLLLAGTASADPYIVLAKGNGFDNKLASKIEAAGGEIVTRVDQIGMAVVDGDIDFAANASTIKGVDTVFADMQIELIEDPGMYPMETGDGSFPSDSFGFLMWGMDAIDAPEAWAAGHTGAGVRVAVIDSGIDSSHPDLIGNLNTSLSASFVPGETFDGPPGSHGTHVAGTIAAGLNGFGVTGVAPDAEIVALKALSAVTGSGATSGIAQAIVYAADIDADVINMSLGSSGGFPKNCTFGDAHFSANQCQAIIKLYTRAIDYANKQGTTVVASAGNDARDLNSDGSLISMPGQLPGVITVSAVAPEGWALDITGTDLDILSSFSNFGTQGIDFSAPGGDFDYPGNELCYFGFPCWVQDMVLSTTAGGSYSWNAGTSMASPHVAGVAALIIGANGGDMAPSKVMAALKKSAEDLGKPGKDAVHGHGRVNALNAVSQ